MLGYEDPSSDFYHPLRDTSLAPEDRLKRFPAWISDYYNQLSYKTQATYPYQSPSPDHPDDDRCQYRIGSISSSWQTRRLGHLAHAERDAPRAIRISQRPHAYPAATPHASGSDWDDVELRCVWCRRSYWVIPWTAWTFRAELDNAEKSPGRKSRKSILRWCRGRIIYIHHPIFRNTIKARGH